MRHRIWLLITGVLFSLGAAAQLATQKVSTDGVTVAVTPANLAPGAKTWDFSVVLETHSQDLSDDLVKTAVLLDDKGKQFKPLGWDGAAPGGHHRQGVLKFGAIAPRPKAIELRISRAGEAKPRVFRWVLN